LDKTEQADLAQLSAVDAGNLLLSYLDYTSDAALRYRQAHPNGEGNGKVWLDPKSHTEIDGYVTIDDVYGRPAILAKVETEREIVLASERTTQQFALTLIILLAVAVMSWLFLVRWLVLRRLNALVEHFNQINSLNGSQQLIEDMGQDELGQLGRAANDMLDKLRQSTQLKASNRSLSSQNAAALKALATERQSLEEQLRKAERMNNLMVNRELRMRELKAQLKAQAAASESVSDTV
jgi:methyl-accepting chemotaxis protein